jgi:hypothetical protein
MPGLTGRSGRRKAAGKLYRFSYRFNPEEDPPELETLLEAITNARGRQRQDILRAALQGAARPAEQVAAALEDSATADVLEDMFADF